MTNDERTATGLGDDMRLGLALSGGGFRASLYHIGVLARLAELDLLRRVEVLSCVSGGSIIGALYYLYLKRALEERDDALRRDDHVRLVQEMEAHFLSEIQRNYRWLTFADIGCNFRMARADYSRTDRFGDLLDEHLYRPVWTGERVPIEMRDLIIRPGGRDFHPEHDNVGRHNMVPVLMLNATTLNSGHAWWFQASRMGEADAGASHDHNMHLRSERYDKLANPIQAAMPLGQAVAASAAVPGILPPLPISELYRDPTDTSDEEPDWLRVQLVDGGVHDNLGFAALDCSGCTHFVVSDATGQMQDRAEPDTWPGAVIGRSSSILMDRVREAELELLIRGRRGRVALMHLRRGLPAAEAHPATRAAAVAPAATGPEETTDHGVHPEGQRRLAEIRTDLDAFSDVEATALMADGYLTTVKELKDLPAEVWPMAPSPPTATGWRFEVMIEPLASDSPKLLDHLDAARHRLFKTLKLDRRALYGAVATSIVAFLLAVMLLWNAGVPIGDLTLDAETQAELAYWLLAAILCYPVYLLGRHLARVSRKLRWLGVAVRWAGSLGTLPVAPLLWLVARTHLHLSNQRFLDAGRLEAIGLPPLPAAQPHQPQAAPGERRDAPEWGHDADLDHDAGYALRENPADADLTDEREGEATEVGADANNGESTGDGGPRP